MRHLDRERRDPETRDGVRGINKGLLILQMYTPIHWIPAQICREQICINPKGIGQENPM